MKTLEEREALIRNYIENERKHRAAIAGRWWEPNPTGAALWSEIVAAFDGDNNAASNALYDICGGQKMTDQPAAAPPKPRVMSAPTLLQVAGHRVEIAETASFPRSASVGLPCNDPKSRVSQAPPRQRGGVVRDPRIPPPGTVIYKRDRHGAVLAEATVREDGIEYAGTIYKSPSAAGLAASIAIGGAKTAIDGYTFWGLNPPKVK